VPSRSYPYRLSLFSIYLVFGILIAIGFLGINSEYPRGISQETPIILKSSRSTISKTYKIPP